MKDLRRLPRVEDVDSYLEFALQKAARKIGQYRPKGQSQVERAKKRERERLAIVRDALIKYLSTIHDGWPSLDELSEFYQALIEHTVGLDGLKHSLGAIGYAKETIKKLTREYSRAIGGCQNSKEVKEQVRQYLGRVKSVFSRVRSELELLERARKTIRKFPTIDADEYTVAIAGFPNVGKSTLLSKLTKASPEVQDYAFTTKGLNTGSFEHRFSKIQLVDTPGTLARDHENDIERLATITRRYAARLVVYVFDPSEQYSFEDQERLRREVESEGCAMVLYLSKTDMAYDDAIARFKKAHPGILTRPQEVLQAIKESFDAWS